MQVLKKLLLVLIVLLAVAALGAAGILAHGYSIAHARVHRAPRELTVIPDSSRIARGEHLAQVICAGCHSPNMTLPLAGGVENLLAVPKGPTFGVLHAPNLTPAGALRSYPEDPPLARAIREGIASDDRALLVMPSAQLRHLSDADLAGLIAYLRSQPGVPSESPPRSYNLAGYAVLGLHLFPNSVQPALTGEVPAAAADSTAGYGGYLVSIIGCRDCHGEALRGGKKGQLPPLGPDLVGMAQSHPQPVFELAVRHGVGSSGRALDPNLMPWRTLAFLDDVEVAAIYRYLAEGAR